MHLFQVHKHHEHENFDLASQAIAVATDAVGSVDSGGNEECVSDKGGAYRSS